MENKGETPVDIATVMRDIAAKASEVERLIGTGRFAEALKSSLADPPLSISDQQCKTANFAAVYSALLSLKAEKDIDAALAILSVDEYDVLMKYLYRALSIGESNTSAICFRLHEKLTEKAGVGTIIRALSSGTSV
eukprot:jgi/Mesvir1/15255/Mv06476-RA.1